MPTVTIAHALFRWTGLDSTRHLAQHGQVVDVPQHVYDRHAGTGTFGPGDTPGRPQRAEIPHAADRSGSSHGLPDRPAYASSKQVWVDYATDLHHATGGRQGYPTATADAMNRRDLIAALAAQAETSRPHQIPPHPENIEGGSVSLTRPSAPFSPPGSETPPEEARKDHSDA